uniref:Prion-inhibition and propagation HeLo domain-containing protein n=1 Tax=Bionectria ochroleuca TaxID=29856 RepID=A0A8H7K1N8_BIOOC
MEPAGVAIGVIGLAGLFNTCLDVVARVDAYRDFGFDSRCLAAQFEADKLRFERWGRAVGLEQGKLSTNYHPSLAEQSTRSVVAHLISTIQEVCRGSESGAWQSPSSEQMPGSDAHRLTQHPTIVSTSPASTRQKLAWALRGKAKRVAEVEKLGILVQKLYEQVPIEADETKKLHGSEVTNLGSMRYIQDIQDALKKIEQDIEAETRRELYAWIGADIPSDMYDDLNSTRVPGTCDWILERDDFRTWLTSIENPSVLWANAAAGFGKTVMCARVIEHLSQTLKMPVAYFFLSSKYSSRDDPYLALRAWITQIMDHDEGAFEFVRRKWLSLHEKIATRTTIISLFHEIAKAASNTTFILDGLDECTWVNLYHQKHDAVSTFVQVIATAIERSSSRWMLVSRNNEYIRNSLCDSFGDGFFEIRITTDDVHNDIVSYSRSLVNQKLSNKSQLVRDTISEQMAEKCDGQFLWVRLQADNLRRASNQLQLQRALSKTPAGLEQLYEWEWESIRTNPTVDTDRSLLLLKWAAFSIRPLSVSEISVAVLIDNEIGVPVEELPDEDDSSYVASDIKDHCGSLIEITNDDENSDQMDSMMVKITHFSVKEFLLTHVFSSGGSLELNTGLLVSHEERQHDFLAEKCLCYIFNLDIWELNALKKGVVNLQASLLTYAAGTWDEHVCRGSQDNSDIVDLANHFFQDETGAFDAWKRWTNRQVVGHKNSPELDENDQQNRLSYSMGLLLHKTTEHLLSKDGCDVNGRGLFGETPLIISCRDNHLENVTQLLSLGANTSISSVAGNVPLCVAVSKGHNELAKLLLDKGADVDIKEAAANDRTALLWAASLGHVDLVKLLLDRGADISLTDKFGNTPLFLAAYKGNLQITQLLLEKGADVAAKTQQGWQPLTAACMMGQIEIASLLLENGADIDVKNEEGWAVIHEAVYNDQIEIVRWLFEREPDLINIITSSGWYPIHIAALNGHLELVRWFLEKQPELISVTDPDGWSPLHKAAEKGHADVVNLLLQKGSDAGMSDNNGTTPLHCALHNGDVQIAELLLLEEGVDVITRDVDGCSPLHLVCNSGNLELATLLLKQTGIDKDACDVLGYTPLAEAVRCGHAEIVKLLLSDKVRAIARTEDRFGLIPPFYALRNNHVEILELLLPKTERWIEWKDSLGRDLMWWAQRLGSLEVANLLVKHGARKSPLYNGNDPGLLPSQSPPFDINLAYCDHCIGLILDDSEAYWCNNCHSGGVCICLECYEAGLRCLDDSHVLAFDVFPVSRE